MYQRNTNLAEKFVQPQFEKVVKLNASTTTRLTTRCSGDLMGDQIAPGDQIGDQITAVTRSLLGDQIDDQISLSRIDSEWSCCLLGKYQGLLNKCELKQALLDDQIAPGDQIFTFWSRRKSGRPSGRRERSGRPSGRRSIWLSIWSW